MAITTRTGKGSQLTWAEMDTNLSELDTRTAEGWQVISGAVSTAGIANAPPIRLYKGVIGVMAFAADTVQECTVFFHIPKNYIDGSDIYPHGHVIPATVSSGDVRWGFDYTWANDYSAVDVAAGPPDVNHKFGTPQTGYITQTITGDQQDANYAIEAAGPMSFPAMKGHAMLIMRVYRDATNVLDTYPDEIYLSSIGLYLRVQGFGKATRFE